MVEALGENRARSVLSKVMQGGASKGIDALKWMDARSVARMIKSEHPQIIALVLAYLQEDQAARVLELLPKESRSDLVMRIARLDTVDPAALEELDRVLEIQLATSDDSPPASVDGLTLAAGILNNLDTELESTVLETVKTTDFDLAEQIENLMFVFDNLLQLDDRGMQRLIREISGDSLLVALKGVDEEMKAKFFSNMSSRAAEMLQDDMEAKGPVKLSDVEAEQKQILTIAKKLADDGEIFIGKGGGDFV
jgi:flagellar motor switch protein FliG